MSPAAATVDGGFLADNAGLCHLFSVRSASSSSCVCITTAVFRLKPMTAAISAGVGNAGGVFRAVTRHMLTERMHVQGALDISHMQIRIASRQLRLDAPMLGVSHGSAVPAAAAFEVCN